MSFARCAFDFVSSKISLYLAILNSNLSNRWVAIEPIICQKTREDAKYPLRSTIQASMQQTPCATLHRAG
jgi:hypothetical protein